MARDRCSFCDKPRVEVDHLVAGPRGVSICAECVGIAYEVVRASRRPASTDRVLTGIGMLVTNDRRRPGLLGVVEEAAVAIRLGKVTWVGEERRIPSRYRALPEVPCGGRMVIPGFVDAATHLTGSGVDGRPQPEVAAAETADRAARSLARGTTTIDIAAGGSGDPITDTSLLAVARVVGERMPCRVDVTWRTASPGASTAVTAGMVETAARLASQVEIPAPVPSGVLSTMRRARLRVRLVEPPPGSLSEGVEVDAVGRLAAPSGDDLAALAGADVPVILTVADLLAGLPWPGRQVLDAGVALAVATGSDPEGMEVAGLGLGVALAVAFGGLTAEEALWAVTRGGALALGAPELGWIGPGAAGDLVVADAAGPADLVGRPDGDTVFRVVAGGELIPV